MHTLAVDRETRLPGFECPQLHRWRIAVSREQRLPVRFRELERQGMRAMFAVDDGEADEEKGPLPESEPDMDRSSWAQVPNLKAARTKAPGMRIFGFRGNPC